MQGREDTAFLFQGAGRVAAAFLLKQPGQGRAVDPEYLGCLHLVSIQGGQYRRGMAPLHHRHGHKFNPFGMSS